MGTNVTRKLIESHLTTGEMKPGQEIGLRVDQVLLPDTTGAAVILELEAMGLDRSRVDTAVIYVDHNLLQSDGRNADDHIFLRSAAQRYGMWYSRPGNGVSHAVHMQRFGSPGRVVLGADSHTPAAGCLGMLAIGAGGIEVASAVAGLPLMLRMPQVWGIELVGQLRPWVSAKDIILEMLRQHGVKGGVGKVIEYYGDGLSSLSAMDRHVIANMGTELGATATVFPADDEVRRYLTLEGRAEQFVELNSDPDAAYDLNGRIDLSRIEPMIAKPPSPGNVVPVREVAGLEVHQAYLGSSANPGLRDLAVPAAMVQNRRVHDAVSFDINPASRETLENLIKMGLLTSLLRAGARLHQAGCNGCIGMGQAPATGRPSLRTTPRNYPGRSGTREDSVYLVSPETATASALVGRIIDPRDLADSLGLDWPSYQDPSPIDYAVNDTMIVAPAPRSGSEVVSLVKGPNIKSLPTFDKLPLSFRGPVLLKLHDDISTDEILSGGTEVLPLRANIPASADYVFRSVDPSYVERAKSVKGAGGHVIVAGQNYGQGSSREHAAIAPRFLGLRFVLAKSYARIHWQNLLNFGIIPLEFENWKDYARITQGDTICVEGLAESLTEQANVVAYNATTEECYEMRCSVSSRQIQMIIAGGLMPLLRDKLDSESARK